MNPMLWRPEKLDSVQDDQSKDVEVNDAKIEKYINRLGRRGYRYLGGLAVLGVVVNPVAAYSSDVIHNYQYVSEASVDISARSDPLSEEYSDSALIILNGVGTQNANSIAKYQGEALQNITDGSLYSVNYRNAPLDHQVITDKIINLADNNDINRISIVGYSAGGNTGVDVALNIIKDSEIDVPTIVFNLTPDGVEGLQPDKQEDLKFVDTIASIPGARYSKHLRFLAEVVSRMDQNPNADFWKTLRTTSDVVYNDQLPGFNLMMDQVMDIVESDIRSRMIEIGKITRQQNKLKPVIIYLAAEPGSDRVVNNQLSYENICGYAQEAGLECIVIEIPGITHDRPDVGAEEYLKSIIASSDEISEALDQAQAERDFRNQLSGKDMD